MAEREHVDDDSGLCFKSLSDYPTVPEDVQRAMEASYRRGFSQGVAAAMRGYEDCDMNLNQMSEYYFKVYEWRYHRDPGKSFTPPEPDDG